MPTRTSPDSVPDLPGERRIRLWLVVAALVDVLYWTLWFTARDAVASNNRPAYVEFEQAFPLADAWLLVAIVGAWWGLGARRPIALFWLLVGGGAGIYLALLDVLYDVENAIWWASGIGGWIELGINVLTVVLSMALMRWGWRHRAALLEGRAGSSR